MNYLEILKKCLIAIIFILIFYLACRLCIFYIPFLIAYIISLIIEPIIKFLNKRTGLSRKTNSIIVLVCIFGIITILIVFGGVKLISETTNLLAGLNTYLEKTINFINDKTSQINFENLKISKEVRSIFENSTNDFLSTITNYIKNLLNKILQYITSIPNMFINIIITILATYFITSDKFYILDRMEHHLSKKMVGKIRKHVKQITTTFHDKLYLKPYSRSKKNIDSSELLHQYLIIDLKYVHILQKKYYINYIYL